MLLIIQQRQNDSPHISHSNREHNTNLLSLL